MSSTTKPKKIWRQLFWFVTLYIGGLVAVGGFIYAIKALLAWIS